MKNAWDFYKGLFGFTIDFGCTKWLEFGLDVNFCLHPKHLYFDSTLAILHTWIRLYWVPLEKGKNDAS